MSKNFQKILNLIFLFLLSFFISQTWAFLPVIDPTEIAKTVQELGVLKDSYAKLQDQYNELKSQYAAMTGQYGWGNVNNSIQDIKQNFEWAPSDWRTALQDLSGGNPQRYQDLLTQYQADHPVVSQENYAKGSAPQLATTYQNQVATNQISATAATREFNDLNQHLDQLQQLGASIEDPQKNNTLKSSVDLNSRIELEVAYISMEELRMQAVLNQQTAATSDAQISEATQTSQFNQAEEANPS